MMWCKKKLPFTQLTGSKFQDRIVFIPQIVIILKERNFSFMPHITFCKCASWFKNQAFIILLVNNWIICFCTICMMLYL